MYNPYPPNYYPYYPNNSYNSNYYPYHQNNGTYNPYNPQQRDVTRLITQCATWENKKFKWVRVNHKELGKILLQTVATNCNPDPNLSFISANFIRPGSCHLEFSEDFSPLDLNAPVDYNGSIPPQHCHC
ncbi:hypothetical protein [Bacillus wiedmannii]|uniref:hypothetical protein n=1 Tax=Bacillus wiedmannii TaxID=1890302 RepID=UPI000BF61112|nr:hypothetical protein [Bacillus wiedmannii]PGA32074.1 hypothetical protein COL74_18875 [Bacillus wiedmannii]PHB99397.1 hypothetical protein COE96_07385 [Bacillus wiedmannii]